jgi:transposase InsO family protein
MSGYSTAQKILRAGYFWPSLFKDCITTIQKCHSFQMYNNKIRSHPTPLHPVVSIGPFRKWGIDFMTCNPHLDRGHGYIILAVDYFTKCAEAMPTFDDTGKNTALFIFNHIITQFDVPQAIVTDHGSHFQNFMMSELTEKLGLWHENSTPYYSQANGQVEVINKFLITMFRRMIGIHKTSWHMMLFSALWAYKTSIKSSTGFTPFQLVYGIEVVFSIECEIPSLKLVVELLPNISDEEEHLLYLMQLDETRRDDALVIETHKKHFKAQYDKHVKPCVFYQGDLVLLYEQDCDLLGAGKFEAMWRGPYIFK